MKEDPTIKAVREARHCISQKVDHDPRKLVAYYWQRQEHHRERFISASKQRQKKENENAA